MHALHTSIKNNIFIAAAVARTRVYIRFASHMPEYSPMGVVNFCCCCWCEWHTAAVHTPNDIYSIPLVCRPSIGRPQSPVVGDMT